MTFSMPRTPGLLIRLAFGAALLLVTVGGASTLAQDAAPSRTPWGEPDLQGTWDYWAFTPLERPAEFAGRETLTAEEASQYAERLHNAAVTDRPATAGASVDGAPYSQAVWSDRGTKVTALTQTSIIVDPRDGKIPPLTPQAARQSEAHKAAGGHPVRIRTGGIGTDESGRSRRGRALPARVQHRPADAARRLQQQRADRSVEP